MVLFGGLVLILTHAKVITLLIENSIEGLQLICSGSGPESRGIISWFEHRSRNSFCTSWVWYCLHLLLPLKLGVLREFVLQKFWVLVVSCSYSSALGIHIFTNRCLFLKKDLTTTAAVLVAQAAVALKALLLEQPVWLLWGSSPVYV